MQEEVASSNLNSDIAGVMEDQAEPEEYQYIAISAHTHNVVALKQDLKKTKKQQPSEQVRQFAAQSPYNNIKHEYTRMGTQNINGKDGAQSSGKSQRGQGVGREVLKSSQGQNRKLEQIFALQKLHNEGSSENMNSAGGTFKMSRSSQNSIVNVKQQRNTRGSVA